MSQQLSQADQEQYWRKGYLFPLQIFSAEKAADHREQLENMEAIHGPMHYKTKPYLLMESAAEIAMHLVLLDKVESILGPDILLWDSAYVIKEPKNKKYVSWHQDLTYWGLDGDELLTAW
ncbi:phytanoyl-CoA dioxygenase family protein, partial [Marine Group I thaumarchaeote]|nr:phytanoyl-CoA dioxygenase family protein [Marine Group I thaumarchaeote]